MSKKIFIIVIGIAILFVPFIGFAQQPAAPALPKALSGNFVQFLWGIWLNAVSPLLWIITWPFVIIMFTLAGFKYFAAHGDPSKISDANKSVMWGLVGATVIVLAWSVTAMISTQLNIIYNQHQQQQQQQQLPNP